MGSEYTPTTEEVRAGWMHSGPLASTVVRALQFDRWHAEELRKARAEALREVADWFWATHPETGESNGRAYNSYKVGSILNYRADQIERGK